MFCAGDESETAGETISLGYYEQEDLMAVINFLRSSGMVSRIGLWGRSMGAATSVLVAARDPSIAGMVLDSAFSSLTQVPLPLASCITEEKQRRRGWSRGEMRCATGGERRARTRV